MVNHISIIHYGDLRWDSWIGGTFSSAVITFVILIRLWTGLFQVFSVNQARYPGQLMKRDTSEGLMGILRNWLVYQERKNMMEPCRSLGISVSPRERLVGSGHGTSNRYRSRSGGSKGAMSGPAQGGEHFLRKCSDPRIASKIFL